MNGLIPSWAVWSVIALAIVGANLPFLNQRIFLFGPVRAPKPALWHVVELVVYAALVATAGRMLEQQISQTAPQRWEFYAVWGGIFLTLGFPGFVWRFLRRGARA